MVKAHEVQIVFLAAHTSGTLKIQEWRMNDQMSRRENAGWENAGIDTQL